MHPDLEARLIREARKSPSYYKHAAAVLSRSGTPICYGHNNGRMHAEQHAILKLLSTPHFRGKKPYTILVVRVSRGGKFGLSKPCSKCIPMLENVGLKVDWTR